MFPPLQGVATGSTPSARLAGCQLSGAVPAEACSTIDSLPFNLLEEIAVFCSSGPSAAARRVCRQWRAAYTEQAGLRLDTHRPASDAAALARAPHPFPRACRATLLLPTAFSFPCTQAQLDAWLQALRQRPAVTQLTITAVGQQQPPSQELLQPLHLSHLSHLSHLTSLTLSSDLSEFWCVAAAAAVGGLQQLTRLEVACSCGRPAALALAPALSHGLPRLAALDVRFRNSNATHDEATYTTLLQAAAAGAPRLSHLACRGVSDVPAMLHHVLAIFGPTSRGLSVHCYGAHRTVLELQAVTNGGSGLDLEAAVHFALKVRSPEAGGQEADLFCAAARAAAAALEILEMGPFVKVAGLRLDQRQSYPPAPAGDPFSESVWEGLDLSNLPPTLASLAFGCPEPAAWPPIRGAATALQSLSLELHCTVPDEAFAPLAAGCPNLRTFSLVGGMPDGLGDLSDLARLHHLTALTVHPSNGTYRRFGAPAQPRPELPSTWLPTNLVSIDLHHLTVPYVAAQRRPPDLALLRTLSLDHCTVDARAFRGATALRKLTFTSSAVLSPSSLGDQRFSVWEVEEADLSGLFAAWGAEAPGAPAGGRSGASGQALRDALVAAARGVPMAAVAAALPRLRRLHLSLHDALRVMDALPHLLTLLPSLSELHLTKPAPSLRDMWGPRGRGGDDVCLTHLERLYTLHGLPHPLVMFGDGQEVMRSVQLIQQLMPHCMVLTDP